MLSAAITYIDTMSGLPTDAEENLMDFHDFANHVGDDRLINDAELMVQGICGPKRPVLEMDNPDGFPYCLKCHRYLFLDDDIAETIELPVLPRMTFLEYATRLRGLYWDLYEISCTAEEGTWLWQEAALLSGVFVCW
jgi:hypothetical protein